jgi:hypothetical protein
VTVIEKFREKHRIEPYWVRSDIGMIEVCRHCGIRVNRIRGGWRHDAREVRLAAGGFVL